MERIKYNFLLKKTDHRIYYLVELYQRDKTYIVKITWGRLGSGRWRIIYEGENFEKADNIFKEILNIRYKRGYRVLDLSENELERVL